MNHDDFRRHLHAFVDGALAEPERLEMDRHAAACRDCARELQALRDLLVAAHGLPRGLEPEADLWPAIAARLGNEAEHRATLPFRWPRFAVPRLRLASAAAFAVLVAGIVGVVLQLARPRGSGDAEVAVVDFAQVLPASLSGLELECMGTGQLLQAALRLPAATPERETAESLAPGLAEGLTILDRSIDETRAALVTDPNNIELQCLLAARFQQKLALLQAALMRVEAT
jgi:hypothetical protein